MRQKPDRQSRDRQTDVCGRPSWGPGMGAHGAGLPICPPLVPRTPSRTNSAEAKVGCQACWPLCWEAPGSRPRGTAKCVHPTWNPAGLTPSAVQRFSSFSSERALQSANALIETPLNTRNRSTKVKASLGLLGPASRPKRNSRPRNHQDSHEDGRGGTRPPAQCPGPERGLPSRQRTQDNR